MNLKFYQFSKKRNSTKQISTETAKDIPNVYLKKPTSVINPTFLLSTDVTAYNYVYVVEWQRYFFVNEITSVNDDIWEVSCVIDSLATWKTDILSYNAFVERSASSYNMQFNDPAISPEQSVDYKSDATTQILAKDPNTGLTNSHVYVRMLGSGSSGIVTYYDNNLNGWGSVFNPIFDNLSNVTLLEAIKAYICDPSKYVISVQQGPISVVNDAGGDPGYLYIRTVDTVDEYVHCGWFATDAVMGQKTRINKRTINRTFTLNKPTSQYSLTDFRTVSPAFSQLIGYFPGVGVVSLSPDILNTTITATYHVDVWTGDVMVMLYSDTKLIATYTGCLYGIIQIGDGGTGGLGGIVKTTESVARDVAISNPIGVVGDSIEGVKSIVSPNPSIIGNMQGAHNGLYPNIILSLRQRQSGDIPRAVYGSPCHSWHVLNTLSGYCKCQLASVAINCEAQILDQINGYLNSGFYIE